MKVFAALSLFLCFLISAQAREYKNMSDYKRLTGNTELNKRDWLKKHRKNNTREWLESCAFNFSYSTGYNEYVTTEQRRDFYRWLQAELRNKGHEVYWPALAAEVAFYAAKIDGDNSEVGKFVKAAGKAVFDNTFSRLQDLYRLQQPLQGPDAATWDKAMIEFEQVQIVQPLYNRISGTTLRKLSNKVRRENLNVIFIPERLEYSGGLVKAEDRIAYAETVLLPYVKGEPALPRLNRENVEPAEITAKKEQKGEKKESEMEENLVKDAKKESKKAARERRKEERNIRKWNKRELKLNVKAIEESAKDPNAY